MKPYDVAKEMYDDGELEDVVEFCLDVGVVISTNEAFICAYKTSSSFFLDEWERPDDWLEKLKVADTWFVYIAAGDVKKLFDMEKDMKYVAFERNDGRARLIESERLRRLL